MEQNFCHKVDQKTIPVCPILGVDIAAIDMDWLLAFTKAHVKELSGDYICVSNVHTTVTAWKDEAYRRSRTAASWPFRMAALCPAPEESGALQRCSG